MAWLLFLMMPVWGISLQWSCGSGPTTPSAPVTIIILVTATNTITPTPGTPTVTPTTTRTPTNTPTNSPTVTPTPTISSTATNSLTGTQTSTETNTPTNTISPTASSTATDSPTPTVTSTATNSPTPTPTNTPTITSTPTAIPTNSRVVTTLAGGGPCCAVNDTGTAASFNYPAGVAVDSFGNVYVADNTNNMIREISPGGVVTTLAGSGLATFANGTGTGASFYAPNGVAVDSSGNVYVADQYNYLVRKITPGGVVSTLAGSGGAGSFNATGTAASFNLPQGVAVDSYGNVYVADNTNDLIREISPVGVVTTLAGQAGATGATNGPAASALFNNPAGVAVDASGNVYVGDSGNHLIREISAGGTVSTLAGQAGVTGANNATGTAATFNNPVGVAVDTLGNVYVADDGNNLIREISPGGVVTTLAGSGSPGSTNATGTAASFSSPFGVAVDSSGIVYVGDHNNQLIRKIQ